MKKIDERGMKKYMARIRKLASETPVQSWVPISLLMIADEDEDTKGGISLERFNQKVVKIPFSDILLLREHGIDFPRKGYDEVLED